MIKKIALCALIIFSSLSFLLPVVNADEGHSHRAMKHIASIDIIPQQLSQKFEYYNTQFMTPARRSLGKYFTFNLNDIVESYISHLPENERKNIFLLMEDGSNKTMVTAYYEIDRTVSRIPPVLIFTKSKGSVGDTIQVYQKGENSKNKIIRIDDLNTNALDAEMSAAVNRRIYLQMKKVSKAEKKRIFQNNTLIFPIDANSKRWMNDIKKIHIYQLNSSN